MKPPTKRQKKTKFPTHIINEHTIENTIDIVDSGYINKSAPMPANTDNSAAATAPITVEEDLFPQDDELNSFLQDENSIPLVGINQEEENPFDEMQQHQQQVKMKRKTPLSQNIEF